MSTTAAAVLWAAAVLASGCGRTGAGGRPSGALLDAVPVGGGHTLVLREGRRGEDMKAWRDLASLERDGVRVWESKVAPVPGTFELVADGDASAVVLGGQPPGSALFSLQVLDRATGVLLWSTAPRNSPARWQLDRGDLFELTQTHLHRYDLRSGERRWSWKLTTEEGFVEEVRITSSEVVVAEVSVGERRLTREGGTEKPADGGAPVRCVVDGEPVTVLDARGPVQIHGCGLFEGRVILAASVAGEEHLMAVDRVGGATGWSTRLENGRVDTGGRAVFRSDAQTWPARRPFLVAEGVAVVDLTTGELRWPPIPDHAPVRQPGRMIVKDGIALVHAEDFLASFDPATGAVARAVDVETARIQESDLRGGRVWVVTRRAWRVLDAATLTPVDGGDPLPDRTSDARLRFGG